MFCFQFSLHCYSDELLFPWQKLQFDFHKTMPVIISVEPFKHSLEQRQSHREFKGVKEAERDTKKQGEREKERAWKKKLFWEDWEILWKSKTSVVEFAGVDKDIVVGKIYLTNDCNEEIFVLIKLEREQKWQQIPHIF